MKKTKLNKEELEIESKIHEYRSMGKAHRSKLEKKIDSAKKTRPVSVRINESDLEILKEKANKSGLPYQTMLNVIIHKYVTDAFLDKDEIEKYLKHVKKIA